MGFANALLSAENALLAAPNRLEPGKEQKSLIRLPTRARRAASAKEVVKRGQDVWVKVISVSAGRLSLSMRDVDQATGRDLLPGARMAADGVNPAGPASGPQAPGAGLRGLSGVNVRSRAACGHMSVGCHIVLLSRVMPLGLSVWEAPRGSASCCLACWYLSATPLSTSLRPGAGLRGLSGVNVRTSQNLCRAQLAAACVLVIVMPCCHRLGAALGYVSC